MAGNIIFHLIQKYCDNHCKLQLDEIVKVGNQGWLSRLVVTIGCHDWLSKLVVMIGCQNWLLWLVVKIFVKLSFLHHLAHLVCQFLAVLISVLNICACFHVLQSIWSIWLTKYCPSRTKLAVPIFTGQWQCTLAATYEFHWDDYFPTITKKGNEKYWM